MPDVAIEPAVVNELFADASQIYVGVVSGGQPHVTPELLATGEGRLWCFTAAGTRKVKLLAEDERVAFFASTERGDVIGIGRGSVVDLLKTRSLTDLVDVARSAVGASRFVARNAAELTGAAFDGLVGKLGRPLPPRRVVVSIEPIALALHNREGVQVWGEWELAGAEPQAEASAVADLDDSAAPEGLRDLLDDGPAALGWLARSGHPLVLPARWTRRESLARVNTSLFRRTGALETSFAAITRDKWTGYGPTGKQGVMLRGHAAAATEGAEVAAAMAIDRITYWDGVETGTTTAR